MDEDEFEDYDSEVELALYKEYRDIVGQFRYVVETERRFYLANEVTLERKDTEHDFYFELTMNDVWVWDVYRSDRFVKSVRVLTFKDVNVEERADKDLELPKELALDEWAVRRGLRSAARWATRLETTARDRPGRAVLPRGVGCRRSPVTCPVTSATGSRAASSLHGGERRPRQAG